MRYSKKKIQEKCLQKLVPTFKKMERFQTNVLKYHLRDPKKEK